MPSRVNKHYQKEKCWYMHTVTKRASLQQNKTEQQTNKQKHCRKDLEDRKKKRCKRRDSGVRTVTEEPIPEAMFTVRWLCLTLGYAPQHTWISTGPFKSILLFGL